MSFMSIYKETLIHLLYIYFLFNYSIIQGNQFLLFSFFYRSSILFAFDEELIGIVLPHAYFNFLYINELLLLF